MDDRLRRNLGIAIGALGPVAVAGMLVGVRDSVDNANVALVLVLVVVVAAAAGGWQAGAVAAVSSTLSFNFFHTEPYLSLNIDSRDDVETAVLLLLVGISVGLVAGWARQARFAARKGSTEIERIHRIADLAARGAPAEEVLAAAQDELQETLDLRACRFEAPPLRAPLPRIERNGAISGSSEHHYGRGGLELPRDGVELPVLGRGQQIGRFVLEPTGGTGFSLEDLVVAVALSDQVGAALSVAAPTPDRTRH